MTDATQLSGTKTDDPCALLRMLNSKHFLLVCLVIAFVLRLAWVSVVHTQQLSDFAWYYARAISISEGNGYAVGGLPTAYWPVGWPAVLGLLFTVLEPSEMLAKLANICLCLGVIVMSYVLAKELFRSRVAASITALVLALYPTYIAFSSVLISETLFTFLILLGVWLMIKAKDRLWLGLFAGIVLGYATLTREQGWLVPLVVLLVLAKDYVRLNRAKRWLGLLVIVHAAMFLTILPWTVRNYRVFGHVITISTNKGVNLFLGNNPRAQGVNIADARIYELLSYKEGATEWEFEQIAHDYAIQYIKTHPAREAVLVVKRLWKLFRADGDGVDWASNGAYSDRTAAVLRGFCHIYYYFIMAPFLIALWVLISRRGSTWKTLKPPTVGLWICACWTCVFLATHGENRYHYAMMPWIIMFAAAWVASRIELPATKKDGSGSPPPASVAQS